MTKKIPLFTTSKDILSGAPVFKGTRVPAQTLFDYFENGETLEEFLEDFPSVTRKQAIQALELAKEVIVHEAVAR